MNASPATFAPTRRDLSDTARLRVGDSERTWTCEHLSAQYTLGRLGPDELDDRLDRCLRSVTRTDLDALLDDLPDLPSEPAPAPVERTPLIRDLVELSVGLCALGAFGIVALMILGSVFLGPGILLFTLVGGSLTAFCTAVFTRAACRPSPRAGGPPPAARPAAAERAR